MGKQNTTTKSWIGFVKETWEDLKKQKKNVSYKEAMVEASRLKKNWKRGGSADTTGTAVSTDVATDVTNTATATATATDAFVDGGAIKKRKPRKTRRKSSSKRIRSKSKSRRHKRR